MWLAQREHSRSELRLKLLRWLARRPVDGLGPLAVGVEAQPEAQPASTAADIDVLLDELQAEQLLSDQRFIDSRVQVRASRFGNRRIEQELRQHGLQIDPAASAQLRESELERARAVHRKKFKLAAVDAAQRARQARFLTARGFSAETVRAVLSGDDELY